MSVVVPNMEPAPSDSLVDLAIKIFASETELHEGLISRSMRLGRLLSRARDLCAESSCGYAGRSAKSRWVSFLRSTRILDAIPYRSVLNYIAVHEHAGGESVDTVKRIGLKMLANFAALTPEQRSSFIERARAGEHVSREIAQVVRAARDAARATDVSADVTAEPEPSVSPLRAQLTASLVAATPARAEEAEAPQDPAEALVASLADATPDDRRRALRAVALGLGFRISLTPFVEAA